VKRVSEEWGPVEILVNNAGVGSSQNAKPIVDFDDEFWNLSFEVNIHAPYRLTKLVLPEMIKNNWGRIINIGSMNSKIPAIHGAAYVATKHAIVGLTKTTAEEAAPNGVTANAICPGAIHTAMNDMRQEYDAKRLGVTRESREKAATPLGRRLEPDEIAPLAVLLASDESRGINGQAINVCGGRFIGVA
jgi:3-hydroxybutyrate dehydrogenase